MSLTNELVLSAPNLHKYRETIQIIVVSCCRKRKCRMKKMYSELKIPYDIEYFDAFTPENSKDYLNYANPETPENDKLICCSRSHNEAINLFITKFPLKEIVLILEDDVIFIKNDFEKELENALDLWEKHPEIDFLNIGYLGKESKSLQSDEVLRWGMDGPGGTLWGAQGYLIKRTVAIKMVKVLNQPTAKNLYDAVFTYLYTHNKGTAYSNKKILLSPDHYLSILWKQGYVYPMLVKEDTSVDSTIWKNSRQEVSWLRKTEDFYQHTYSHSPIVITYDNTCEKPNFFIETIKNNDWDYLCVGVGETWKGIITRINAYKKVLSEFPDDKIVILSDSHDVICMRSPHLFIEMFKQFKKPIVVGMELFCGGKPDVPEDYANYQCKPLHAYWRHHVSTPERKFVNRGLVAGYAGDLKVMLEWIIENGHTDDQYGLGCFMCKFPDLVAADHEAKLLHTSGFGINAGIEIPFQKFDSPTLAELFGRGAFFLHIPGHDISVGQKKVYDTIVSIIRLGIDEKAMNSLYPKYDKYFKKMF
jgi:GR25 family glycosyltransferase involved in LPS biosynthesis